MEGAMADLIGAEWLAREYDVAPVQPFRVQSRIGGSRETYRDGDYWRHTYPEQYRPEPTLVGHLEFMLKREGVHLEFFARLFAKAGHDEISRWAQGSPTGKYARRAGFFYEWITGRPLDFEGVRNGGYVDALDSREALQATRATNVPRWRVSDNLPGTPEFCPSVRSTETIREAEAFDIAAGWHDLEEEFGVDLLARSVVWLTIKESRASFAIEGEQNQTDRIRRFAAVMERHVGRRDDVLTPAALESLQTEILGERATRYGVRRSPIFVGETRGMLEIVHYIGPEWSRVLLMIAALDAVEERTRGQNALIRAAILSFGFVYIHPLTDGNGRISRFLVNDVLRRDGAVPSPYLLPISATISRSAAGRREYDRALENLSEPLMARYRRLYRFGKTTRYEDGTESNLEFDAYDDALPVWRYPDFTSHATYTYGLVRTTLQEELREEARQLRAYRGARERVKAVLEGPDADLDRIVRSVQGIWAISGKLRAEFPLLEDEALAKDVVEAVRQGLEEI